MFFLGLFFLRSKLYYNDTYYPKDLNTNFNSKKGKGPPYSLGSIWYFWVQFVEKEGTDHGFYMRECKKVGVPHVSLVDRQELTSWLKGNDAISHGQEDTSIFDPASDIVEPVYKKQKSGVSADNGMIVETTKTMELSTSEAAPSKDLTDDQIELIKQKARERKSGSQHSGRSNTMDVEIQPEIFVEKRAKQPIARDIIQREKLMFNSQTILQSPEGYPFTQCLKTVQNLINKENEEKERIKKTQAAAQGHNRYGKVNEAEYWQERNVAVTDFQLDTRGTFNDIEGIEKLKNTIANVNREEVNQSQTKSQPQTTNTNSTPTIDDSHLQQQRKRSHSDIDLTRSRHVLETPIIILPGRSTQSILNLNNAKQFLSDFSFINPLDITENVKGTKIDIEYTPKNGNALKVRLVDNVSDLNRRDWSNVIAVFVHGQEWQFKSFPQEWGGVAGIFTRTKGFYIHFGDEKIPKTVESWNVKTLSVNKNKRHLDGTAVKKFWDELEQELKKRNYIK